MPRFKLDIFPTRGLALGGHVDVNWSSLQLAVTLGPFAFSLTIEWGK